MKHGSLFSGIGGFDLAAEWMGWENVFHCEWNEFGQKVLKHYWPQAISYADITKSDFTIHRGQIDILSGGFPCQPYSQAGKRLGKEDDRHLWPEMLRAIREIQPRWVVGENVRGLTNWNGGLVFDEVQADLESEGYEVTPFLLPACAVNAPHRRDRIWFVAFNTKCESGCRYNTGESKGARVDMGRNLLVQKGWNKSEHEFNSSGHDGNVAYATIKRLEKSRQAGERELSKESGKRLDNRSKFLSAGTWTGFPTQPPVCNGNDGISARLDGITFSKWRNESLKAGGNAIVPQVAHQIFKAIEAFQAAS